MSPREEVLALFLAAFEAWGVQRQFDRAIELADQASQAAAEMGDDDTARRVIEAAAVIQGLSAPFAMPGPIRRAGDEVI